MNQLLAARKKTIIVGVALLVMLLGNVFFALGYFVQAKEAHRLQEELNAKHTNEKIVEFLKLFIDKVLKTDKEVSFEDRLKLENAIRDLQDPEILAKWEAFTGGTTAEQIQSSVKDLLEALANKMHY